MRLWHKDIIDVLPRQQLLGQWRELCCIASNIKSSNTPNHLLVNKVLNFSWNHFKTYCIGVINEMRRRGYNVCEEKLWKHQFWEETAHSEIDTKSLYLGWHNDRYLKQCLYNLQEKYDCGGISNEEWEKIAKKFQKYLSP